MVVSALNAHLWIFNFLVDATFSPKQGRSYYASYEIMSKEFHTFFYISSNILF